MKSYRIVLILLFLIACMLSCRAEDLLILSDPVSIDDGTLVLTRRQQGDSLQKDSLFLHFHGNARTVAAQFAKAKHQGVLAIINFPGLSKAYATPFQKEGLFDELLAKVSAKMRSLSGKSWTEIHLSSFSAGYGAVRQIIKTPRNFNRITSILAADSLYASLEPDTEDRRPLKVHMKDYLRFAQQAVDGKKIFVLTHSDQSTSYASTTETANDLLANLSIGREMAPSSGVPMNLKTTAQKGQFKVFGYSGKTGEDHLAHLRNMHLWWPLLTDPGLNK